MIEIRIAVLSHQHFKSFIVINYRSKLNFTKDYFRLTVSFVFAEKTLNVASVNESLDGVATLGQTNKT